MQTYHFYAVNKDGSYTTISGYGNTKEEAFNNALEKTPEEATLKEDKPKAKITPSVKPIPSAERSQSPIYYFFQDGQQLINRNGSIYRVKEVILQTELVLVRSDGWQLKAHNPKMYLDGGSLRMEWDYSTGGHFTEQTF